MLTAARTNEAIGARWDEIDLSEKVWTIPAERMKAARPHRVPLSDRVVEILKDLPREAGGYVFPGAKSGRPLSNMAMLELVRGMSGNGFTTHGFRSSFRDWAKEQTSFPREICKLALAHVVADKSEAAYSRGDALDKRRQLMAAWARLRRANPRRRGQRHSDPCGVMKMTGSKTTSVRRRVEVDLLGIEFAVATRTGEKDSVAQLILLGFPRDENERKYSQALCEEAVVARGKSHAVLRDISP